MNIYWSFDEIGFNKNTVLTVGTFDGVHLGHRQIIDRLKEIAVKDGLRPVLITIDPHPQVVLKKDGKEPIKVLTVISERLKLFEMLGVENVLVIPFTYEFSQTPPETFVRDFLQKKVGFKKILIGYDHLFGKNREGDETLLQRLGSELGFETEKVAAKQEHEIIISSTKIRNALHDSDLTLAKEFLGYDYFVDGLIIHGAGRGAQLGFPTANFKPLSEYKLLPHYGIYLVKSKIDGVDTWGIANMGMRPTFADVLEPLLEVYYLDFHRDIYGKDLSVSFIKYIRQELKFNSVDDLIIKMEQDEKLCRELIKSFL